MNCYWFQVCSDDCISSGSLTGWRYGPECHTSVQEEICHNPAVQANLRNMATSTLNIHDLCLVWLFYIVCLTVNRNVQRGKSHLNGYKLSINIEIGQIYRTVKHISTLLEAGTIFKPTIQWDWAKWTESKPVQRCVLE